MTVAAYKLWYDYIRYAYENETDRVWNEEVRRDFAGVVTKTFDEWFDIPSRFSLFVDLKARINNAPVQIVLTRKQIEEALAAQDSTPDDELPSSFIAIVDTTFPHAQILKMFERRLNVYKDTKRKSGRPEWVAPAGKYSFARRPDVSSLKIALAAWKLAKKHEKDKDWPIWRIGQELSKTFDVMKNDRIKETEDGMYDDDDIVSKQKELEKNARRYLQLADAVLDGVVKGIFPAKPAPR